MQVFATVALIFRSRIIVKNLPKKITLDRFKQHFLKHGEVTDAKLVFTKEGVFRRFGYIGYKTEKEAQSAIDYFNNTFVDTSRIVVEPAFSTTGNATYRPWSKHSKGSTAYDRREQSGRSKSLTSQGNDASGQATSDKKADFKSHNMEFQDEADKERFEQFMQVMQPRSQAKTWGNDDCGPTEIQQKATPSDELTQTLPDIKDETNNNDSEPMPDSTSGELQEMLDDEKIEENKKKSVAHDQAVSDLDYFKSKMSMLDEEMPSEPKQEVLEELEEEKVEPKEPKEDTAIMTEEDLLRALGEEEEKEILPADIIADTGRLLVQNLSYLTTTDEVTAFFSKYGPLSEVHIPIDKITKQSKGYAFVLFLIPEHAVKAFTELDGAIFQGRILTVLPAKEKLQSKDEAEAESLSFKEKRAREQKKNAMKSDHSWNSLFMNSDAVADAISARLGVRKSDILDASSDNMAVRLALAETQLLNETKEFLEEEGVCLDAFTKTKERSKTIILVKNITYGTSEDELETLFGKFGALVRIVVPPAKTMALIEFTEQNEAKSAFRHLAYSKFKSLPLYLEWAPMGTFKGAPKKKQSVESNSEEPNKEQAKKVLDHVNDEVDDSDAMPVATLFVKNLNFNTTQEQLKDAFSSLSGLQNVRIVTKPDKKTGKTLSMGFGFVEFRRKEDAMKAIKAMQGFKLDGHGLELKFSNASTKSTSKNEAIKALSNKTKNTVINKGTKLIVRNIPFEATKRDIQQLFRSFGQVKAVRIPTKLDGSHRGFGFVDFLTKQEAKSAFDSLSATHLYGRHLVIEWAEDDESVDALREKTKRSFQADGDASAKKRRVVLGDDDPEK